MKCVVTGGCGFIGSHLCELLVSQGHDVIAVDNFFSGSADNVVAFLQEKLKILKPTLLILEVLTRLLKSRLGFPFWLVWPISFRPSRILKDILM